MAPHNIYKRTDISYKVCWETYSLIDVPSSPTRYQIPVSVEGHEVNIDWTLLTQSQQRDKDKPAVRMDTPRSGYSLVGVVSDQYRVNTSLCVHSSKE